MCLTSNWGILIQGIIDQICVLVAVAKRHDLPSSQALWHEINHHH